MKRIISVVLALYIGFASASDHANAQKLKLQLSKDKVAEADYFLENGTLLSTLIKIKFVGRVFDLPPGAVFADPSNISTAFLPLWEKLQTISQKWGTFQLRKMIPNSTWGDTLVENTHTHKQARVPDFSQF